MCTNGNKILVHSPPNLSFPFKPKNIASLKPSYCLYIAGTLNCKSQVDAVGRVAPAVCIKTSDGLMSNPRGGSELAPEKNTSTSSRVQSTSLSTIVEIK